MDQTDHIVLSVLVIAHNQRHLLSRCLDSILAQRLDVPYEVIVSDDRSTDGTWELIQQYQQLHPTIVRGVKCNSDECNPSGRSERCGWNKANAYRNARGEFFVNIDADDYLKSDDIYQLQLDTLLANPDCAMCQQRVWQVCDGASLETGFAWPQHSMLKTGAKLTPAAIAQWGLLGLNQTYMIRRNPLGENPAERYGRLYDDTVITYYHLQFGKAIFVDRADYVWVQYGGSISNSAKGWDKEVSYGLLPYQHALLIPRFRNLFLSQPNLRLVHVLKRSLFHKIALQAGIKQYLSQFEGFIFRYYSGGQRGLVSKLRLFRILLQYKQNSKRSKVSEADLDKLYRLLIR